MGFWFLELLFFCYTSRDKAQRLLQRHPKMLLKTMIWVSIKIPFSFAEFYLKRKTHWTTKNINLVTLDPIPTTNQTIQKQKQKKKLFFSWNLVCNHVMLTLLSVFIRGKRLNTVETKRTGEKVSFFLFFYFLVRWKWLSFSRNRWRN